MTEAVSALVDYGFSLKNGTWNVEGESLLNICIHCFATNIGSRRVAEKAGFRLEGISKSAVYKRGKIMDLSMYGISRDEWEEQGRNEASKAV
jgi:RimJ/RimL family protein N-acetyltransferase